MISAITWPFIYFIVVVPVRCLQNSHKAIVNQTPLHVKGEQAKQNQAKTNAQETNAFCSHTLPGDRTVTHPSYAKL